jgi:hypothetical protein
MKIQTTSILDLTTLLEKALTKNFSFKNKPLLKKLNEKRMKKVYNV